MSNHVRYRQDVGVELRLLAPRAAGWTSRRHALTGPRSAGWVSSSRQLVPTATHGAERVTFHRRDPNQPYQTIGQLGTPVKTPGCYIANVPSYTVEKPITMIGVPVNTWTLYDLARLIDHTNLHADATEDDMRKLCDEAKRYHFRMVAINQVQSRFCAEQLKGTDVHVGAAIAFPLGQISIEAKVFETRDALSNGANEIDYVVNLTQVKQHNWSYVEEEMRQIVTVCNEAGVPSKVIFENCYLTDDEKVCLCEIAKVVKPTFIKTSTGFGTGGATVKDVSLMKEHVGKEVLVKAAGGIRNADAFLAMVHAGARRIGTSAGVTIIQELNERMEASGTSSIVV